MPTPRKKKTQSVELGDRVSHQRVDGRPVNGVELTQSIAARIEAVRERLEGDANDSPAPWRRLTWRSFAKRIGLTEEALRDRRRGIVQFDLHDIVRICREFNVRAEFLLRGEKPMLHSDVMNDLTPPGFAGAMHLHMTQVLAVKLEQSPVWVAEHLPDADVLLASIELGVGDALDTDVQSGVRDRVLSNAIRHAVAAHIGGGPARVAVPDTFLLDVGKQQFVGSIIDIGNRPEHRSATDSERSDRSIANEQSNPPIAESLPPNSSSS
ncbi:MAG TPA: hypothetical protein VIP11_21195 [Gemmatimonadaceae bacterium]